MTLASPEEVRTTLTNLLPPHLRDAPTVPAYSRRIGVAGTTISRALVRGIDRRHLDRWVRRASAIAPEPPPVPASKAGLVLTADELAGASLAVLARRHGVGIAVIRGLRKQLGIQTTRGRKSIPGYEIMISLGNIGNYDRLLQLERLSFEFHRLGSAAWAAKRAKLIRGWMRADARSAERMAA